MPEAETGEQGMLPPTIAELDHIRAECKTMVTKAAALSGGVALVPVVGVDIAADMGLLLELLPRINRRFGLAPEQIAQLDAQTRMLVYNMVIAVGGQLVGKVISRRLVLRVLRKVGVRMTADQVLRYVPIVGQAASAALSFAAMKYVGNAHVNECYAIAKRVIETKLLPPGT
jgi:hypothetical protein